MAQAYSGLVSNALDPALHVETERLWLRPWTPVDRPAFARMAQDPEMMRYINGGIALDDPFIDAFLSRQTAMQSEHGFCLGALCLRSSGEVIGVAGAQRLDRMDTIDIGWWVWREHWRQGYAREVARGIVDAMFGRPDVTELLACIDPGNAASRRVAEGLEMVKTGSTTADRTASWRPALPIDLWTLGRT